VLHTWNQKLDIHPHIHCLVPGGGFSKDGFVVMERFLISYKRLRHVFKIKLLQRLRQLLKQGALNVARASAYRLLDDADSRTWNMKVKRALAGPDAVIKYFARYTKRIGLSDSRLTAYDGNGVTYAYRDRQDGNRVKAANLEAPTFCLRFLNHVLPTGFVRIRRYGFWSNRARKSRSEMARRALNAEPPPPRLSESRSAACQRIFGKDPTRCAKCGEGQLILVGRWPPTKVPMDIVLANLFPRSP
jgi:hypothetical protein